MRFLLAFAALGALAACAHGGSSPSSGSSPTDARVGYVRMDDIVKKHPMYGQLAQYDQNIAALNLSAVIPRAVAVSPDLKRQESDLERRLSEAAKRTDTVLRAKGEEFQKRENVAIAAALRSASAPGGATVAGVTGTMERTAQGQIAGVNAGAQNDLVAYQKQLQAQDNAQIVAMQRTLTARADRTYRAKADQINAGESALSLKLASDDATQRLSLRTRLSSLALDDAARDDAQKQLADLDRKEADALAAQRNRDQPVLAALQTQLRDQVQAQMRDQVAQIHAKSVARYRARQGDFQKQFAAPSRGPLITTKIVNGKQVAVVDPALPPPLRQRIETLHANYAKAFQADAKATIDDFNKTRANLKARYDALNGSDQSAAQNAQNEIASLRKKRADLYEQMVSQIGREVKTIAQRRGIQIVVSNPAAPAGGVDLTDDAMKDIETLHE